MWKRPIGWWESTYGNVPCVRTAGLSADIDPLSVDISRLYVDICQLSVDISRLAVHISQLSGDTAGYRSTSAYWPWTSVVCRSTSVRCEWTSARWRSTSARISRRQFQVLSPRLPRLAPTYFTSRQHAKSRAVNAVLRARSPHRR